MSGPDEIRTTHAIRPDDPIHSLHRILLKRVERMRTIIPRIENSHPLIATAFLVYDRLLPQNIYDLDVEALRYAGMTLYTHIDEACPRGGVTTIEPEVAGLLQALVNVHAAYIAGPLLPYGEGNEQ